MNIIIFSELYINSMRNEFNSLVHIIDKIETLLKGIRSFHQKNGKKKVFLIAIYQT